VFKNRTAANRGLGRDATHRKSAIRWEGDNLVPKQLVTPATRQVARASNPEKLLNQTKKVCHTLPCPSMGVIALQGGTTSKKRDCQRGDGRYKNQAIGKDGGGHWRPKEPLRTNGRKKATPGWGARFVGDKEQKDGEQKQNPFNLSKKAGGKIKEKLGLQVRWERPRSPKGKKWDIFKKRQGRGDNVKPESFGALWNSFDSIEKKRVRTAEKPLAWGGGAER